MRIAALASCLMLLCACGGIKGPRSLLPQVHRMELVQGNIITQQMVDQLQTGMSREQVQFVMGTPLVQDSFSSGTWRYYYRFQDDRRRAVVRRVTLHFEDELLADISGDLVPNPAAEQPDADEPQQPDDGIPDDEGPGKPDDDAPERPGNGSSDDGEPARPDDGSPQDGAPQDKSP